MKRIAAVLLAICMVFAFAACGGGGEESASGGETAAGSESSGDSGAASGEALVIKAGHVETEESPLGQSFIKFKEWVESESGGSIRVDVYANGELGSDRQVFEAVNLGTIQMSVGSISVLTQYDEKFALSMLPFTFDGPEAENAAIMGSFGQKIIDWMADYGFKCFGFQYDGARSISNSKGPINTVADMKGLKIRVMESDLYVRLFNLFGANPTPMSFTEIYTALSQGTVDGQDNPPSLTYESKFTEVQKYYSLTRHTYSECPIVANPDWFNGLTAEQQTIVTEGAETWLRDWQRETAMGLENDYIDKIRESGVEVNELTPEGLETFKEAVLPMYEEYEEKLGDVYGELMSLAS
ncbi:MAG: TRAP transporter substrate-binding protein [Clostridiales Family XIII bacterium]|jgi:tripartite ATP-independent transporter DctP family solute receptor|nr:TRAP transporter substrate-binding protein [Clostridiales Family XIII bacterium]